MGYIGSGYLNLLKVTLVMLEEEPSELNQSVHKRLARLAYCRLKSKNFQHWKILLLMACLRKAGVFDTYSMLDEIIWTGYAAFVDD